MPNALKQMLLRPTHDWCMRVKRMIHMDGTYDQLLPLERLHGLMTWSYDLTSATDRFPLEIQQLIIEKLFNRVTSWAWVVSGLGVNAFQAPRKSRKEGLGKILIRFVTGQPLGCLSSWPLFALCHHIVVWLAADRVYPGKKFSRYAILGDDLVIADGDVAREYRSGQSGCEDIVLFNIQHRLF